MTFTAKQIGIAFAAFVGLTDEFSEFIKAAETIYKLVEVEEADDKVIVAKLLKQVAGFTSLDEKNLTYFVEKCVYWAKVYNGIEK
ncbi:MAG: hypothetical protein Unbinned1473contig1000_29 [Prokaryotic dsDNA virus sp.]|nr:MAG: hypothetical protein Unbinned1473contig1000_29 [Prokaryotic dsDNA virus sp.]|tara:strand:- start:553 stop:807 length:255 start_codon:yes stop_codon:yes gene_type:complete